MIEYSSIPVKTMYYMINFSEMFRHSTYYERRVSDITRCPHIRLYTIYLQFYKYSYCYTHNDVDYFWGNHPSLNGGNIYTCNISNILYM